MANIIPEGALAPHTVKQHTTAIDNQAKMKWVQDRLKRIDKSKAMSGLIVFKKIDARKAYVNLIKELVYGKIAYTPTVGSEWAAAKLDWVEDTNHRVAQLFDELLIGAERIL